jgi:hypothetical protein
MSIATRRYTYQDLVETPDDGRRYEIIDGELYASASPQDSVESVNGRMRSSVLPDLEIDLNAILASLPEFDEA